VPVHPLGPPEPVGGLFELHEEAGIELRVLPELWTFWAAVTASTLGFSGIRLRNARRTCVRNERHARPDLTDERAGPSAQG
jgi:hypothetical protein